VTVTDRPMNDAPFCRVKNVKIDDAVNWSGVLSSVPHGDTAN